MDVPSCVKIVHLVLGLNVGGLERMVLRLLAYTDRARFSPSVCALDAPGVLAPELDRLGVPLTVLPRRRGLDACLPMRLASWLRREGAQLVHTHNASPHLYGALAARLAHIRVVHTKHGRNAPDVPRKVLVNSFASALTDRIVAVSDDAAGVAVSLEGVNPRKVVTILNGVDTSEFRPGFDPVAARAELGVPAGGFHVGCVARLDVVKDHATLLEAFARLLGYRPDAHLTCIGGGPELSAIEAHASRLGLGSALTLAGERGDLAGLYAAFDVFALASRSEGISLTLLEASSSGLPVVATRVGGNPEIVADGETGYLVRPRDPAAFADALFTVACRADRAQLGAAGRARVERRFSVERMAREYQALYTEVLGIG